MYVNIPPLFPFVAIAGQEELQTALILNVIDPLIGGVMIMGDRGTGKSTAVRSLVDLLQPIMLEEGDEFNLPPLELFGYSDEYSVEYDDDDYIPTYYFGQVPMVDLPLGATEDKVCGTIDIERALTDGVKSFEPGLLAKANRGVLYVDEINLLDDHLVDILLDSAASGWNTVEREGVSLKHPSRFVLVGSGNPEEGELRPQLLDRFGMYAKVRTLKEPEIRVLIVQERAFFDEMPFHSLTFHRKNTDKLARFISDAQNILDYVEIDYSLLIKISDLCVLLGIDGLRGDIVTSRAAKAHAAFCGRLEVCLYDIKKVINLCIGHRLKKDPLDPLDSGDKIKIAFEQIFGSDGTPNNPGVQLFD